MRESLGARGRRSYLGKNEFCLLQKRAGRTKLKQDLIPAVKRSCFQCMLKYHCSLWLRAFTLSWSCWIKQLRPARWNPKSLGVTFSSVASPIPVFVPSLCHPKVSKLFQFKQIQFTTKSENPKNPAPQSQINSTIQHSISHPGRIVRPSAPGSQRPGHGPPSRNAARTKRISRTWPRATRLCLRSPVASWQVPESRPVHHWN